MNYVIDLVGQIQCVGFAREGFNEVEESEYRI